MAAQFDANTGMFVFPDGTNGLPDILPAAPSPPPGNAFTAGLHEGALGLLGTGGAVVQGLGAATGMDALAKWGKSYSEEKEKAAAAYARPDLAKAPWEEDGSPTGAWLANRLGSMAPSLAAQIAGAALIPGAAVPAALTRVGAVLPNILGGAGLRAGAGFAARKAALETGEGLAKFGMAGIPLSIGANVERAQQGDGDLTQGEAAASIAAGVPEGLLGALMPGGLHKLLPGGTTENIAARVLSHAAQGAVPTALQSGLQTAITQQFDGRDIPVEDRAREIINSALTGGALGGVMGGALGMRKVATLKPGEVSNDALSSATDEALNPQQQPQTQPELSLDQTTPQPTQADWLRKRFESGDFSPSSGVELPEQPLSPFGEPGGTQTPASPALQLEAPPHTDAAGQIDMLRPYHDVDHSELMNEVRDIAERKAQGNVTPDELNEGVGMLQELQLRNDPKQADLWPDVAERNAKAPIYENTRDTIREDLPADKAKRAQIEPYLSRLRAEDTTDAYNRVRDDMNRKNPPAGAMALGEYWGIGADYSAKIREVEAERSKVQAREKAGGRVPSRDMDASWNNRIERYKELQRRETSANERRDQDNAAGEAALSKLQRAKANGLKPIEQDVLDRVHPDHQDMWKKLNDIRNEADDRVKGPTDAVTNASTNIKERAFKLMKQLSGQEPGLAPNAQLQFARIRKAYNDRMLGDTAMTPKQRELALSYDQRMKERNPDYTTGATPGEQAPPKGWRGTTGVAEPRSALPAGLPRDQIDNYLISQMPKAEQDATRRAMAEEASKPMGDAIEKIANRPDRELSATVREAPDQTTQPVQEAPKVDTKQADTVAKTVKDGRNTIHNRAVDSLDHINKSNQDIAAIGSTEGAHLGHVLDYLQNTPQPSDVQALAKGLQRRGVKSSLKITEDIPEAHNTASEGNGAMGAGYDENTNTTYLSPQSRDMVTDLLHEGVHEASWGGIEANGPFAKQLASLFNYTKTMLGYKTTQQHYGLRNDLHEFLAEAMTNKPLQNLLEGLKPRGEQQGVWSKIKDAIFKFLGLPTSAKNLFDQVMTAGHGVMDEHAALSPERLHELMSGSSEPSTPATINATTRVLGKRVSTLQEQAEKMIMTKGWGINALSNAGRRLLLGWNTFTTLVRSVEHSVPSLTELPKLHTNEETLNARVNQVRATAQTEANAWAANSSRPRERSDMLNHAMALTANGIDIRKPWAENNWLHDRANAGDLRALLEGDGHKVWNQLKQTGGDKIYNNLLAVTQSERFAQLATSMHNLVDGEYRAAMELHFKDGDQSWADTFARAPGDMFRERNDLHDNAQGSLQFWKDHLAKQLEPVNAILKSAQGDVATEVDARAKGRIQKIINPLSQMRDDIYKVTTSMNQAPNFHLGRSGDFMASVHLPVNEKGEVNLGAQAGLERLLEKDFGDVAFNHLPEKSNIYMRVQNEDQLAALHGLLTTAMEKGYLNAEKGIVAGNVSSPNIMRTVAPKAIKQIMESAKFNRDDIAYDGMTSEQLDKMEEAHNLNLRQLKGMWLDMLPERNVAKMLMPRKAISGWNKDMMENYAKRGQIMANAISKSTYSPQIASQLSKARIEARDLKTNPKDLNETLKAHDVVSELALRDAQRPWKVQNGFIDRLQTATHSYFLGFNPGYVATVLSQVPLLLHPELAKANGVGFVKSAALITKNMGLAFKVMKAAASGPHALEGLFTRDAMIKEGIAPKTADFIISCSNRGCFDLGSLTRELGSPARGDLETGVKKFMKWGNVMGIYAESYARVLSALAARDVHGAKEGLEPYVDHVVEQANFNWSRWNAPRQTGKTGFAGQLSPLAFKFMGYQIMMLEKLYHETGEAIASANPADRAASRAWLGNHLATATITAGAMGLPIVFTLAQLGAKIGASLTGTETYDVNAGFRNFLSDTFGTELGEVMAHGVPRALGLDYSKLGDQDLIPFSKLLADRRKWEDASADWAKSLMGPASGMGTNIVQGMRDMAYGDYLGGMEKLAPTSLRNPLEAYKMAVEGYTNNKGQKLPITADAFDIAAQALGFTPGDRAEYREAAQTLQGARAERQFVRSRVEASYLRAVQSGNQQDMTNALAQVTEFDKRNPANALAPKLGSLQVRRQTQEAVSEGTGLPLGIKLNNPLEQQLLRFTNTQ